MGLPTTLVPDLTPLGYFGPGSNEKHSICRFQRRSLTSLRKKDDGCRTSRKHFRMSANWSASRKRNFAERTTGIMISIIARVSSIAACFVCLALAFTASGPTTGTLVSVPASLRLAVQPGGPLTAHPQGSPALILQSRQLGPRHWTRLLAADGSAGWTASLLPRALPVEISINRLTDDPDASAGANHSPDDPSPTDPVQLKGRLHVTGASKRNAVAAEDQIGLPETRNWFLTPWLQVTGANGRAWFPSSALCFRWDTTVFPPRGLIRPPFTAALSAIQSAAPKAGMPVLSFDESEGPELKPSTSQEHWKTIQSAYLPTGAPEDAVSLFDASGTRLLQAYVGAVRIALIFRRYSPELTRVKCDKPQSRMRHVCLADITTRSGDGYGATLWILKTGQEGKPEIQHMPLYTAGSDNGEAVESTWSFDAQTGTLTIQKPGSNKPERIHL